MEKNVFQEHVLPGDKQFRILFYIKAPYICGLEGEVSTDFFQDKRGYINSKPMASHFRLARRQHRLPPPLACEKV